MNTEVRKQSTHKYESFLRRVSVQETMDTLTNILSEMYENDQYHTDKNPEDTFRVKLGLPSQKNQEEVDPEQVESIKS